MSNLQALLEQVRAAVAAHGDEWLQSGLAAVPAVSVPGPAAPERRERQRRSRPPERLSPEVTPRIRRRMRSPSRDPLPAAGRQSPCPAGGVGRRNPSARRGSAGAGSGASPSLAPMRRSDQRGDAAASGDVPVGAAARRSDRQAAGRRCRAAASEVAGTSEGRVSGGERRGRRLEQDRRPAVGLRGAAEG